MAQSYSSILDKPLADIEPPKAMPVGTYLGVIDGPAEFSKSREKQTDQCDFTVKILQPMDDVDRDALRDCGGFSDKKIRLRFWLTEDAVYRLKEFLVDHLNIDGTMGLREAIAQAPGKQFMFHGRHRPAQDGSRMFFEIDSTAAA